MQTPLRRGTVAQVAEEFASTRRGEIATETRRHGAKICWKKQRTRGEGGVPPLVVMERVPQRHEGKRDRGRFPLENNGTSTGRQRQDNSPVGSERLSCDSGGVYLPPGFCKSPAQAGVKVRNELIVKELSNALAPKSEERVRKRLKRKKFTFSCVARERQNAGGPQRESRMDRVNTRYVSTSVMITEAISMER